MALTKERKQELISTYGKNEKTLVTLMCRLRF
jgi:hypothetical protein